MKHVVSVTLAILAVISLCIILKYQQRVEVARMQDERTFSTTQEWDSFLKNTITESFYTDDSVLPPPPKNSSRQTKKELAELHTLQKERDAHSLKEIQNEIFLEDVYFGTETFNQLTNISTKPLTHTLFSFIAEMEVGIIMREKAIWNRVRPSYLDSTLSPALEVPAHPSYPSGHATQAFLRALVFSELDPKHTDAYMTSARRIAHNREVAGLHYKSDSEAGNLLASHMLQELKKDKVFFELLQSSKTEW